MELANERNFILYEYFGRWIQRTQTGPLTDKLKYYILVLTKVEVGPTDEKTSMYIYGALMALFICID